jgi:hypothetical protein
MVNGEVVLHKGVRLHDSDLDSENERWLGRRMNQTMVNNNLTRSEFRDVRNIMSSYRSEKWVETNQYA